MHVRQRRRLQVALAIGDVQALARGQPQPFRLQVHRVDKAARRRRELAQLAAAGREVIDRVGAAQPQALAIGDQGGDAR